MAHPYVASLLQAGYEKAGTVTNMVVSPRLADHLFIEPTPSLSKWRCADV